MKSKICLFLFSLISSFLFAQENIDYNNPRILLESGIKYYLNEKYFEAIDVLRASLKINPYYGEAYNYLAKTYLELGYGELALENSLNALKYSGKTPEILITLANIYQYIKNYEEAEKYYNQAIEINPSYEEGYRNLGELYLEINRFKKAYEMFKKAEFINNKSWKNKISFGDYHFKKGEYRIAEDYFKQAFNINTKERKIYLRLGKYYYDTKDYNKAISTLEAGKNLFENFYSGILLLSEIYLNLSFTDTNYGWKAYENLIWIERNNSFLYNNKQKGDLYFKIALSLEKLDKNKSIEYYESALENDYDNQYIRSCYESFVIKNFPIDNEIRKELSKYYYQKADSFLKNGENNLYILSLRRALYLNPFYLEPRYKLIEYYELNKDYENLLNELNLLINLDNSYKIKDKKEKLEWNINTKKINIKKSEILPYRGIVLVNTENNKLEEIFLENFIYYSKYFIKFKFYGIEFRKKQGINYILEYLRKINYNFFIIFALDDKKNENVITIYDKSGKVIDEKIKKINIQNINYEIIGILSLLNNEFPEVYKIEGEKEKNIFYINKGKKDNIKENDKFMAYDIENNFQKLAILDVIKIDNDYTELKISSNITKKMIDLNNKFILNYNSVKNTADELKIKRLISE